MESDPPTAFYARTLSLIVLLFIAGVAGAQPDQAAVLQDLVSVEAPQQAAPLSPLITLVGGIAATIFGSLFFLVQTALGSMSRLTSNGEEGDFFWEKSSVAGYEGSRMFERMSWAGGLFNHTLGLFLISAWGAYSLPFSIATNSIIISLIVVTIQFVFFDMVIRQIGMAYTNTVLQVLALPIYIFSYPIRLIMVFYFFLLGSKHQPMSNLYLREREFRLLPFLERIEQVVEEEAVELIDSVREFMHSTARDVMTPRTEIVGIERSKEAEEVYQFLRKTHHSRVVVYSKNMDHIEGFLLAKEVLLRKNQDPMKFLRQPVRANVTDRLPELLIELKRNHAYLAIVQDEYGGTAGIITLQDIFKVVMGDQLLEGDEGSGDLWIESDGTHRTLISGRVEVWELNQELNTEFDESIARTIGGLVMHEAGKLPEIGEVITLNEGEFTVREIENNRVKSLLFNPKLPAQADTTLEKKAGEEDE